MRLPGAVALGLGLALLLTGAPGRAWYFPEHVVIAHDGLVQLPLEVRAILGESAARARAERLTVCGSVEGDLEDHLQKIPIATKMLRSEVSVACVPYAALSALAGDHANDAAELRGVLMSNKGIELASAAAYEWGRFHAALDRLPNRSLERMSFVHDLDVAFYFLDPGYELRAQASRAHFVAAGRPLAEVAREAVVAGALDNALGQFLAHHARSLERGARGDLGEALLEHAFALHFLQDAFSAGHLVVTDAMWFARGNAGVRRRHDFFDAKGLAASRALAAERCGTLGAATLEIGLSPCWTTTGDGHLGLAPDASDRAHAARAAAKAELELAIAIDGARVVAVAEALSPRGALALGELLDPEPWWTAPARERGRLVPSAERAVARVRGAAAAAARLREGPAMPAVTVGAAPAGPIFDVRWLEAALAPGTGMGTSESESEIGASLFRPMLVDWPTAAADVSTLEGESKIDHGWALQLFAAGSAGALFPPRAPVDFFAPAASVSAGLSYRWGTYLPGRRNRALAELNVGISEALHFDTAAQAGGNPHVTMLDQELRWPIAFEILTSYLLPLDLRRSHDAGTTVFLSGVRVHELLTNPAPVFWGFELEVAAIALSSGGGSYPLYAASPELRFHFGLADPAAAHAGLPHAWGPTFGITLTGGYATFL